MSEFDDIRQMQNALTRARYQAEEEEVPPTPAEAACVSPAFAQANGRIIGISPLGGDEIFGGYDETVWMRDNEHYVLTAQERVALADQMIALWTERRAQWAAENL